MIVKYMHRGDDLVEHRTREACFGAQCTNHSANSMCYPDHFDAYRSTSNTIAPSTGNAISFLHDCCGLKCCLIIAGELGTTKVHLIVKGGTSKISGANSAALILDNFFLRCLIFL